MKADQERVKNLLIDTVTLLCKNSLTYQDELCIEGLLGVKVDQKDVFFVHISQAFQNELSMSKSASKQNNEHVTDLGTRTDRHKSDKEVERIAVKRERVEEQEKLDYSECKEYSSPKDPGTVGASQAEIVAGQRRTPRQSHTSRTNLSSPRAAQDTVCNSPLDSSIQEQLEDDNDTGNDTFGEPPSKRHFKCEPLPDGGSSLIGTDGTDELSPWPHLGAQAANFGLMAAQLSQAVARDFENGQSATADPSQPGCSTWPFTAGIVPSTTTEPRVGGVQRNHGSLLGSPRGHRTSGGGREFPCNICGKIFHMGHHLRQHVRIHTGERPYRCEVCGGTFTQISSLNRHQKAQHGFSSFSKSLTQVPIIPADVMLSNQILGLEKQGDVETDTSDAMENCTESATLDEEMPQSNHVILTSPHFANSSQDTNTSDLTASPQGGQYMCTDCNLDFKKYETFLDHVKESHSGS